MEELTKEAVLARLNHAEEALEKCQRSAIASQYASAIIHEVNNPLEAITNLIYLTKLIKTTQIRYARICSLSKSNCEFLDA